MQDYSEADRVCPRSDDRRPEATFVEGGVVDDWGRQFVGADAIKGWSDNEFIGKHVSRDLRHIEQEGEATVVTAEVGGEGFNGPSHFSFLVEATGSPR